MASNLNESLDELDFTQTLGKRDTRRTYLLTYAHADMERFPECHNFASMVMAAFSVGPSNSQVTQWACAKEPHKDGNFHYHMIVKLSASRRWNSVFKYIYDNHNVAINFSSQHCGYSAGYKYVCKNKDIETVLHSEGHPNLTEIGSPQTKNAMRAFSQKRKSEKQKSITADEASTSKKTNKRKRLSNGQVSSFIVKNNIHRNQELKAAAKVRLDNGENDLNEFVLNKTPKQINDLISLTWEIHDAPKVLERENQTRMDVLRSYLDKDCVENCNGRWLENAKEVLRNNDINIYTFADAMRRCIREGRRKGVNIMLLGPFNCAKSFLLDPLELMYKAFMNPASAKYAFVGMDSCEVAVLNDFRFNSEMISWSELLNLLEGQTVHLPRPKNLYPNDMEIHRTNNLAIFATSKTDVEYLGRYNQQDQRENEMMACRWNVFRFTHIIPQEEIERKKCSACPHCFSKMVMMGSEADA